MEQNKYYKVTITYPRVARKISEAVELIAMNDFLCGGIEEFSLNEETVDDYLGSRSYSGGDIPQDILDEVEEKFLDNDATPFHYYFYEDDAKTNALDFMGTIRQEYPELKADLSEEIVQDWNQEWKKHYAPIEISNNLEIIPSFFMETYESRAKTSLYIDPGMGFGTGSHETTFLCLKTFTQLVEEKKIPQNSSILDFGCGSGILGLAALKMINQAKVDFYDIDENSLGNTLTNLRLNQLEKNFTLMLPKNREKFRKHYDLIFANILLPVLLLEYQNFTKLMIPGSFLILSGVLNEQTSDLIEHYVSEKSFDLIEKFSKGDWNALLLKRN